MFIEVFVLDTNRRLFHVLRKLGDFYWVSVLFAIDFVEEFAVSIQKLSADGSRIFGQPAGIRDVLKEENCIDDKKNDSEGSKSGKDFDA